MPGWVAMTGGVGRPDDERSPDHEPDGPVWASADPDDEVERASWQDWQRTFNDRILANLFRRPVEGT